MSNNCAGWTKSQHTKTEVKQWSNKHKKWVYAHDQFGIKQKCWS